MKDHNYEVVQNDSGWVLRRHRMALVEFPTQDQAVRAGLAVCRDEGLPLLRIRQSDGGVQEMDPLMTELDTFEV